MQLVVFVFFSLAALLCLIDSAVIDVAAALACRAAGAANLLQKCGAIFKLIDYARFVCLFVLLIVFMMLNSREKVVDNKYMYCYIIMLVIKKLLYTVLKV